MKKIITCGLFLFALLGIGNAETSSNIVFINRIMLSNSIKKDALNLSEPKLSQHAFRITDEIIFFYASIGVINATKKEYEVEYVCVDSNDNTVIKGIKKINFSELPKYQLGKDTINGNAPITFILNPKLGAMEKGQLIPLKTDNDYYVKLYVEKELIGVADFYYDTAS